MDLVEHDLTFTLTFFPLLFGVLRGYKGKQRASREGGKDAEAKDAAGACGATAVLKRKGVSSCSMIEEFCRNHWEAWINLQHGGAI